MRGFVHKEPEEVSVMIKKGHGTEHDLEGRLITDGIDIVGGEYRGELSIFSYARIKTGSIEFRGCHIRGKLDLEGLEIDNGQLIISDVTVDGHLLLPRLLIGVTKLSNFRVRGQLVWV